MSSKISLSAFVYTRTYSVDYRTLVIPDDFSDEKQKWVIAHLKEVNTAIALQSLSAPVELLQRLFLSDGQHHIFGVLCNLKKLLTEDERKDLAEKYLNQAEEKAKDLTIDERNRQIPFTFVGYVIKKNADIPDLPPISFELDIFKPLCEHICHKWLEEIKSYSTLLPYEIQESSSWLIDQSPKTDSLHNLNTDPKKTALHPGAEAYTRQLWTAAALCNRPQTLWIGQLPKNPPPESILVSSVPEKNIQESRFLNISLPNIPSHKTYSKQPDITVDISPIQPDSDPQTHEGSFIDCWNAFLASEKQRAEKLASVFSNKSDEYKKEVLDLQATIKELQKKFQIDLQNMKQEKDEQIADLRAELRERFKKLEDMQ